MKIKTMPSLAQFPDNTERPEPVQQCE